MSAKSSVSDVRLVSSATLCSHLRADKAVRAPMSPGRRNVFETIRDKQQWHTPPDPEAAKLGFRGWHSRGYLPHFDMPGLVQFINYRLDDAMPAHRRHEWAALLEIKDDLKRRTKMEDYLDRCFGNCELRDPKAASTVEENWLHFDGQDYCVLAWVVMPNHVHLLVEIWQKPMTELLQNWKGYTARRINRALRRRGKLWQDDYWDRYIRDEAHYQKIVHYIESNPVKAGLAKTPEQWPFSSARLRDEYNQLKHPPKP
jgi:putative transposase